MKDVLIVAFSFATVSLSASKAIRWLARAAKNKIESFFSYQEKNKGPQDE